MQQKLHARHYTSAGFRRCQSHDLRINDIIWDCNPDDILPNDSIFHSLRLQFIWQFFPMLTHFIHKHYVDLWLFDLWPSNDICTAYLQQLPDAPINPKSWDWCNLNPKILGYNKIICCKSCQDHGIENLSIPKYKNGNPEFHLTTITVISLINNAPIICKELTAMCCKGTM